MTEILLVASQSVVDLMFWVTAIAAVLGLFATIVKTLGPPFKAMKSTLDWLEDFRESWEGRPAAPGRDYEPGVPERLYNIEAELNHNSGSSVKDAVVGINQIVHELQEQVDRMESRQIEVAQVTSGVILTGKDSIERANYNSALIWDALRKHGIEIPDPLVYKEFDGGLPR